MLQEKELKETKEELDNKTAEIQNFNFNPSLSGTLERESYQNPGFQFSFDNNPRIFDPYRAPRFSRNKSPLSINKYPSPPSYYQYNPTAHTNVTIPRLTPPSFQVTRFIIFFRVFLTKCRILKIIKTSKITIRRCELETHQIQDHLKATKLQQRHSSRWRI